MLDFLQVDANSHKLKIDQKFSWWVWTKMAVSNWVLGWTDFLHACANSGKLKVILMIFGGYSQKWVWPFSLWDPKICCILKWVYELKLNFACWLWCNNFLVKLIPFSVYFTFKWQSSAVVLFRPPAVAGRVPWKRVWLSFQPAVCPGVFLELDH